MYTQNIKNLAFQLEKKYINVRRHLHQYPEFAFKEYKTGRFLQQELEKLGLETGNAALTGVLGILRGGKPGRTFAIRADMDALPITEENTFEYISRHEGYMHACGHDIHMSVVLGAAEILSSFRDDLEGSIVFLFQPGEEGHGGGRLMVEEGIIQKLGIEEIIACHVSPSLPVGQVSLRSGPAMASQSEFHIVINGRGGHAAQPHLAADPIIAGVNIINMLQSIITREKNPIESAVLSVTAFNAGNTFNVIPDRAELKGTVRTFSQEANDMIARRMKEISSLISNSAGVTCETTYITGYPAVVNHQQTVDLIEGAALKILGQGGVLTGIDPVMLSEDFSYYTRVIPGALYNLGCRSPEACSAANLHNPKFCPDENCIIKGMEVMSQCAVDFLMSKPTAGSDK